MIQPPGTHLAEFNFGILRHDWDDPRVAGFANFTNAVNRVAQRSKGFVWQLDEAAMEAAQHDPDGVFGGNARTAATLSVWTDADALAQFVWHSVHRKFFDRRRDWFDPETGGNLVMWWVPAGHRPGIAEAHARFQQRETQGDSAHAFGWDWLGRPSR